MVMMLKVSKFENDLGFFFFFIKYTQVPEMDWVTRVKEELQENH